MVPVAGHGVDGCQQQPLMGGQSCNKLCKIKYNEKCAYDVVSSMGHILLHIVDATHCSECQVSSLDHTASHSRCNTVQNAGFLQLKQFPDIINGEKLYKSIRKMKINMGH